MCYNSCLFFGPSHLSESECLRLFPILQDEIRRLITEEHCRVFRAADYGCFSLLACHIVLILKKEFPDVLLAFDLPCLPKLRRRLSRPQRAFNAMLMDCDAFHTLSVFPFIGIQKAAISWTLQKSNFLLSCVSGFKPHRRFVSISCTLLNVREISVK